MHKIKAYLGYIWMLLAVSLVGFMIWQANEKVAQAAEGISRTNTLLQWVIILIIFIPICGGLYIFGKYASQGEYEEESKMKN